MKKKSMVYLYFSMICMGILVISNCKENEDLIDSANFIREASKRADFEISAGNIALKRSEVYEVRSYALKMTLDYDEIYKALINLPAAKKINFKDNVINSSYENVYSELQNIESLAFDEAYINKIIQIQQEDIKLYERAASLADNQEVKTFAAKTLSTVQNHLQRALEVQKVFEVL